MTSSPVKSPRLAKLKDQLLVFAGAALLLALGMDRELSVYDEAIVLTGAMRVVAGEIPHSDFYANYGPAQFYVLAAMFKVFGQYALVERAYDVLVRATIVTVCYRLTATFTRKEIALVVALMIALWLYSITFYGYPIFPVLLLSLVSTALILPVLAGYFSVWRVVATGATVGLVALFRYDVGFGVFIALGALLATSAVIRSDNIGNSRHKIISDLRLYLLGTSIVFLPVAVCYMVVAPIDRFIHDIISYPLHYYSRMRSLPFPGVTEIVGSIDNLAVYLPILICFAAVYSILIARADIQKRSQASSESDAGERCKDWLLITLAVLTGVLYLKGLVRVSIGHIVASLISSLVLLALIFVRALDQGHLARAVAGALSVMCLITSIYESYEAMQERARKGSSLFTQVAAKLISRSPDSNFSCAMPRGLPRIQCLLLDSDRAEAARFVISNTRPDERIFVGLTRHDKTFANDNLIYFAAGRMPATRWHHFDPGLQTRADVQSEMIAELESFNVRYVILESTWDDTAEPNDSAKSSGVHLLDQYIGMNFQLVQRYGQVFVLSRRLP
jgi:hypothetical protein